MTRTVYGGGRVLDARTGELAAADVAVADGVVAEVGTGLDGDERVDVTGCSVLPGLFDAHVHVNAFTPDLLDRAQAPFTYQFYAGQRNLLRTLRAGVTSVRDAGGADLGLKRAVEQGVVLGPRLQISVNAIGTTGGHTDPWKPGGAPIYHWLPHPGRPAVVADGPESMRTVARTLFRAGADQLKVCTSGGVMSLADSPHHAYLDRAEVTALVAEAERRGSYVMAHAQGRDGIAVALDGGVRSIEHGTYLDEELAGRMAEAGTWLVPTLSVLDEILSDRPGVRISHASRRKAEEARGAAEAAVRCASAAGVPIAMGTDAGVGRHGRNLQELRLMHRAGLPVADVLRAATWSAADLLGVADEVGELAPGKRADLVVFTGDVTDLGDDLEDRLRHVVVDGTDLLPTIDRVLSHTTGD